MEVFLYVVFASVILYAVFFGKKSVGSVDSVNGIEEKSGFGGRFDTGNNLSPYYKPSEFLSE